MLYLFCGDDSKNKLIAYEKFLKTSTKGVEVFSISRNNFDKAQIESLYSGSGLFFSSCVVTFSGVLEREEMREFILNKLAFMQSSPNSFVFSEGKLLKPVLDAFKKLKPEKIQINIFELPKEKKEKFNNFLLANAFGAKDKLNLWIYFRQAMEREVGLEELVGVLFWKIKDMISKRDFSKFKDTELKKIASKLSYLLPEARTSGVEADIALEQFLLEIF